MKKKEVRVADVLLNNMTILANCTDVDSLKKAVLEILKDNYEEITDKEAADKLKKITTTTKSRKALFSTLVTYITNIKVA